MKMFFSWKNEESHRRRSYSSSSSYCLALLCHCGYCCCCCWYFSQFRESCLAWFGLGKKINRIEKTSHIAVALKGWDSIHSILKLKLRPRPRLVSSLILSLSWLGAGADISPAHAIDAIFHEQRSLLALAVLLFSEFVSMFEWNLKSQANSTNLRLFF